MTIDPIAYLYYLFLNYESYHMKLRKAKHFPRYILTIRGTGWGSVYYRNKTTSYKPAQRDLKDVAYFNQINWGNVS